MRTNILVVLLILIAVYIAGSLAEASLDIRQWATNTRIICAVAFGLCSLLYLLIWKRI